LATSTALSIFSSASSKVSSITVSPQKSVQSGYRFHAQSWFSVPGSISVPAGGDGTVLKSS
jgi:hypothetical protein